LKGAGAFFSFCLIACSGGTVAGSMLEPTLHASPGETGRDNQIMTELGYLVIAADVTSPANLDVRILNRARGGNESGSPLGCYYCNPPLTFDSTYTSEPSEIVVAWTYDLHRFTQEQDGLQDMRSYKYHTEGIPEYRKVRQFALNWWKNSQSAVFNDLLPLSQQAFVYDAIVDGVDIWARYAVLWRTGGGADAVIYNDVLLNTYRNASAADIFF
jgi:hypothetical protein